MSFTPSLNVVVLGTGEAAQQHLDALRAVRANESLVSEDGQRVLLSVGLWAPEREHKAMRVLASEHSIGLYGHDPEDLIQAPDIHAVIACLEIPSEQRVALLRAVVTSTHALAVPPIASATDEVDQLIEIADSKGLVTAISEGDAFAAVESFLHAIVNKNPDGLSWRRWLNADVKQSPEEEAIEEIRLALQALPPEALKVRARLERALDLLTSD